jgi:hypothetical protein
MKVCPFCKRKSIRLLDITLHITPLIRRELLCLNCDHKVETELEFIALLIAFFLGVVVFLALVLWFIMININIENVVNIRYLGILILSLSVQVGFEVAFCSIKKG